MKPATWMIGGSVASWLVATAVTGPVMGRELLAGMLGPLLVAVVHVGDGGQDVQARIPSA